MGRLSDHIRKHDSWSHARWCSRLLLWLCGRGTTIEVVPNNINDATQIARHAMVKFKLELDAVFEYGLVPAH